MTNNRAMITGVDANSGFVFWRIEPAWPEAVARDLVASIEAERRAIIGRMYKAWAEKHYAVGGTDEP